MRRRARPTAVLLAALVATAATLADEPTLSPAAGQALDRFLYLDCAAAEDGSTTAAIVQYADELEPVFTTLLVDGPGEERIDAAEARANERWARRQAFLESGPWLGLDPERTAAVESLTLEAYVARELANLDSLVRERAVLALAAIGTPTALATLRAASTEADAALRELILDKLGRERPVARSAPKIKGARSVPVASPRD